MSPMHGRDLAEVCVDTAEGDELEVEAGGPDNLTQHDAAMLAFEVVSKPVKITVIPMYANLHSNVSFFYTLELLYSRTFNQCA